MHVCASNEPTRLLIVFSLFQLVAGSAVVAFEEVCPDRIDLVHKNYRKLCNLLVDVEDWGQVAIINMLTRYARSQFANPNAEVSRQEGNCLNPRNWFSSRDKRWVRRNSTAQRTTGVQIVTAKMKTRLQQKRLKRRRNHT